MRKKPIVTGQAVDFGKPVYTFLVQLSRNSGRRGVICNGHCHQFKSNKKPEKSERLMVPLKKPALQAALKKRLFKAYFNFTCPDPTFYSNRNSFFYFERVGK
jgi:hypothetical protein